VYNKIKKKGRENNMDFTKGGLVEYGFLGFESVNDLYNNKCIKIPKTKGVYIVFRETLTKPVFESKSKGGFHKRKNPTVSIQKLENAWVENAYVLYIGKADLTSNTNLRKRIYDYLSFGKGKNVGHFGGRYIWQLSDCYELKIAWKALDREDPKDLEEQLIIYF